MLLMEQILQALKNARTQIKCLGSSTDEVNNAHLAELDGLIQILEKPNPDKEKFYWWVVLVGIHSTWVADGADFTDARVHDMLASYHRHAYGYELEGKVLGRPPDKAVANEMGFDTVAHYREDRDK
jgi:hypothetical protein